MVLGLFQVIRPYPSSLSLLKTYQHRLRAVVPDEVVDDDVVLVELGSGVVPAHDPLLGVDLLEHLVHDLQVAVVQVPTLLVFVVLVERDGEGVAVKCVWFLSVFSSHFLDSVE